MSKDPRRRQPGNRFEEFPEAEIEQPIPARFERQVEREPGRLAIRSGRREFTYGTLNAAANRLAQAILEHPGPGGEPIAVLLGHGPSSIVALLAVLKAGKIYVPLDPSYPQARIADLLADSRAALVVTSSEHLALLHRLDRSHLPRIDLDEEGPLRSGENPGPSIAPDALAYILYTSGSTGRPKGVLQTHRNVLQDVRQYTRILHICRDDRLTLLHSSSVNAGVKAALSALLNGAALFPYDVRAQGVAGLATLLSREGITLYQSVPSVFRAFAATLSGPPSFPALRLIRLGGERVLARDVELYRKHFSDACLLYTGLGTTETGHVRQYFMDHDTLITGGTAPLGYEVEGKEVLLLGEDGSEVGLGQAGEIVIRSRYISPGYWRRADLTSAAFLPDRTGGDERLYRTGDLGRMRQDGCLEYLGRRDFQVKIRGYRVELAEIEVALLELPGIREAAVVAWEDDAVGTYLAAYVVQDAESAPSASELRAGLGEKLPTHMVPARFVMMDSLPLTPNGKVDRRALPPPDEAPPQPGPAPQAPRNALEDTLATIWAEVLRRDGIGIHDDFFALGGHSLLVTQVASRMRAALGVDLPLRTFYDAPTLAGLAVAVDDYALKAGHTSPSGDGT